MALSEENKAHIGIFLGINLTDQNLISSYELVESNATLTEYVVQILTDILAIDSTKRDLLVNSHVDKVDEINVRSEKGVYLLNIERLRLIKRLASACKLEPEFSMDVHHPRKSC